MNRQITIKVSEDNKLMTEVVGWSIEEAIGIFERVKYGVLKHCDVQQSHDPTLFNSVPNVQGSVATEAPSSNSVD